jgi:hypothetical protein
MMLPGPDVEICAAMLNLYLADCERGRRLPTAAEQLAIDTVAAWTNGPPARPRPVLRLVQREA